MLSMNNAQFQIYPKQQFSAPHFQISSQDYWVIVGFNGSGKSAFGKILDQQLSLVSGDYINQFQRIALLSFEKQQQILEQTFKDRNNDTNSPDDFGKTAREFILDKASNPELLEGYAEKLRITSFLDRPFMQLSTGESRKVLLAQALVNEPELLIFDEPFEGLDVKSVEEWQALLAQLQEKMALVLIVNRFSDIPEQANAIALLDNCELVLQGSRDEMENQSLYQQLRYAENAENLPIPESAVPISRVLDNQPPFILENVTVKYGDKVILNQLNWRVEQGQNWWIKGPNGAGKSTLLSLLTGDHPQAFSNKVILFGKQRGSGETIWEIKQNLGYVSSQLHMDYRVNCSVLDVILSGFFDSIGVYQKVPDALRIKAMQWLERIKLENLAKKPFRSLSWGQQRLLLITRAMVKHPPVLILDEPLQGLDGLNRKLVKSFIEQLVNNSQTQLLFVSHQEQDAPDCLTHLFEFIPQEGSYIYQQQPISL